MSHCYIAYVPQAGINKDMRVVKIGHSANPAQRFQQLCAMGWLSPGWIEFTYDYHGAVAGSEIERFMHNKLEADRIHHEWFHTSIADLRSAKEAVERQFNVFWDLHDISDIDVMDKAAEVLAQRAGT